MQPYLYKGIQMSTETNLGECLKISVKAAKKKKFLERECEVVRECSIWFPFYKIFSFYIRILSHYYVIFS